MATDPLQPFEFGGEFYDEVQSRIATMIGKLTVPATRDPLVKEVHQELLDFAHWWDRTFEEKDEE